MLSDLVSHRCFIAASASLEELHQLFKKTDVRFLAVVESGKVIGLCGRDSMAAIMGSRFGFALYSHTPVSDHLLSNPTLVRDDQPVLSVVNQALTRQGVEFYADIAIVNKDGGLVGLIELSRMAALQTAWLQQHTEEVEAANRSLQIEIEERRRAETKSHEAQIAAEHSARAKADFLATMSHELRTPLNAVLGFAELLQTVPMKPEEADWCSQITTSGWMLLRLINDILDLSKIEAGCVEITRETVNLHQTLTTVFGHHRARALEKGLVFSFQPEPDVPLEVKLDPLRLSQITGNLLSNAIKFTETGSVAMELVSRRTGANSAQLELRIRDTGIGIKEEQKARIFDKFAQADSSTTRRYGGTGLGLAISRQLTELMGGTLSVTSEVNQGSCFTISLNVDVEKWQKPFNIEKAPVRPDDKGGSSNKHNKQLREVLLVEDVIANQILATALLKKLGYTVTVAQNGRDAVNLATTREFSCILMDCRMPEMDGYEATRLIREFGVTGSGRPVPIIAVTAHSMFGDRELCMAAGMDDYITKPFGFGDLQRVLHLWVQR